MTHIVEAQGLGKCYGNLRALNNISFSINPGECFGFLGDNGAGKSTTMRMIYGLSTVDEGSLRIFDQPIKLTPPEIKQRIGIVPQEDNLDPDLSVVENLEVYGGLFGLGRRETFSRSLQLLSLMGLDDKIHAPIESLSGGLKRRLVIARALINQPELIILDEPTTGLDPQARHLVWQKLRGLKTQGATLILTTHYMEEATQLCDRLVIMHNGSILAQGRPRELIEHYTLQDAVEIHLPLEAIPGNLKANVVQAGGQVLQVTDGLFLYSDDGEALWQQLKSWGIPRKSCYLRPANLEDVFLKLTGKAGEK